MISVWTYPCHICKEKFEVDHELKCSCGSSQWCAGTIIDDEGNMTSERREGLIYLGNVYSYVTACAPYHKCYKELIEKCHQKEEQRIIKRKAEKYDRLVQFMAENEIGRNYD